MGLTIQDAVTRRRGDAGRKAFSPCLPLPVSPCHNFSIRKRTLTDHSKLLARLIEKLLPDKEERELVVEILGQYGHEGFHAETDRVRMAILKLAGRSPERIRYFTLQACRDYRDVLCAAEYPCQTGQHFLKEKDPERYVQLEKEDREQYRLWYLGILWEGKTGEQ